MAKPSSVDLPKAQRRRKGNPQGIRKPIPHNKQRKSKRLLQVVAEETIQKSASTAVDQARTAKANKRGQEHLDPKPFLEPPTKKQKPSGSAHQRDSPPRSVEYWLAESTWPPVLFQPDPMAYMLARKKSSASLSRKRSVDGSIISSQKSEEKSAEKTREEKSAPYRTSMYEEQLGLKGFHMEVNSIGPNDASLLVYQNLLDQRPSTPHGTLFDPHLFTGACENIRNKNETRVIRDISELIVPSAESLLLRGSITTNNLVESVNEGWNHTDPITNVRPQPDFSVGFGRKAFTEDQLSKLRPFLGDSITQVSRLRATWFMYFPFLSCEVKCGAGALDIADRQNAHSMGIATRAVVDIFRLAGCIQEVNRKILAFSISHDDRCVRIYGYYPVISNEGDCTFHRHAINEVTIQANGGRDRWTTYRFVHSVYQIWAPEHLKSILAVLDKLPADSMKTRSESLQSTGLSQNVAESHISDNESPFHEHTDADLQNPMQPTSHPTPETSVSTSQSRTIIGNATSARKQQHRKKAK